MARQHQFPRTPSAFVIAITPFDEHGNLDEDAWRLHCQRMVAAGIGMYAGARLPASSTTSRRRRSSAFWPSPSRR